MALIRYPGSKAKLLKPIISRYPIQMTFPLVADHYPWEYREPFFGAGAIGFEAMSRMSRQSQMWINDIDPGMVALWRSVHRDPDGLIDMVSGFTPTAEQFYLFKDEDGRTDISELESGFRKLALHRMSYSGLGFMSGGPLGGKDQENAKYPVECRWTAETIKRDIRMLHRQLRRFSSVRITHGDFSALVQDAPDPCFIYLDPPYYEKGPALYKHSMDDDDHRRLATLLRGCRARWVLSYDDHPFIRDIYSWAVVDEIEMTYTMAKVQKNHRPKNREILITPHADSLPIPNAS